MPEHGSNMRGLETVNMTDMETETEHLLHKQQKSSHQFETAKQQKHMCNHVYLPELQIPFFDGDKMKWRQFWDLFKVTVDQNERLSEKLCYLKSKLTGNAEQVSSGLSMSHENYTVAKSLLQDRFEDNQTILNFHFTELINLAPVTNTSKGLRFLYDKIENHLRSLDALQQDINLDIFISIISSKIPKDVFLHLELQKGARNKWSVRMLRELFNNYICAAESAEELSYSSNGQSELGSQIVINGKRTPQRNSINPQLFVQCRFCDGNHWSDQCVEYPTAKDRKLRIKNSCFLCLKRGHVAYKCLLNKTCFYCGRKNHHNRSPCPQKFTEKETEQVVDRVTQHIMGDYQIIETKQKYENEATRNLTREIKHEQRHTTVEMEHETETTPVNNQEPFNSPNTEISDQMIKCREMVEDSCDPRQLDKVAVNKLIKENSELQAVNVEINSMLSAITEELFKIQQENKDLEAQLRDISASLAHKHELSEAAARSQSAESTCDVVAAKDWTKTMEKGNNEFTKFKRKMDLTRRTPEKGTGFETDGEDPIDFKTKEHRERFSICRKGFTDTGICETFLGCGSVVEFPRFYFNSSNI